MKRVVPQSISDWLSELISDRSGISLIYITVALPAIIGFALLSVDVGRVWSLQSSLQNGADALALAGAGELDRRPDAITRANTAINTLITGNTSLFGASQITINGAAVSRCYLQSLPASDTTPINPGNCLSNTADNAEITRFVQVKVTPQDFATIFPASFVGAAVNLQASAEAVAGFDAAVCKFTPMFICNPYEAAGNTDIMNSTELMKHFDRTNYPDRIGRLIDMKQTGGNGAQYFPGNFGFLVPPGAANPGASELRSYTGLAVPPACFRASGVTLRTGAITSVRFGFNTRFDMYDGPMSSAKNDVNYRPAVDTRKGMANDKNGGAGSGCNPSDFSDPNNGSKLLRDTCFTTGSCPNMGGRMGNGVWDKTTYWRRAHNGASLPGAISGQYVSRYDVYNYELSSINTLVKNDSNGAATGGEIGYPRCYNGPSGSIDQAPDRRIFHAAILNCRALDASPAYGPIQGGNNNQLPVLAFARFFITEAVSGDKNDPNQVDGDIWAEMVGLDEPGNADSVARDIVQLYR